MTLREYLENLMRDPDAKDRHLSSADTARGMMSESGLSSQQQDAVLSGDHRMVDVALRSEGSAGVDQGQTLVFPGGGDHDGDHGGDDGQNGDGGERGGSDDGA